MGAGWPFFKLLVVLRLSSQSTVWVCGEAECASLSKGVNCLKSPKTFAKYFLFCTQSMATKSKPSSPYNKFEIRTRNPNPKTSILLVIDAQNYFSSTVNPILPSLNTTIDLCRHASVPIIFTRHRHKSPADHGMLGEWWDGDLIIDGTPAAELMPELDRKPEDAVVEKSTYGAFTGTGLEGRLREAGVEEVIVAGVMTNLCCETTAREAFVRGFRVFFSTDATGTAEVELHEASLKNLAYGFAYLVDCQRIRDAFSM